MIKKVVMPAAGQTTDIATVTKLKVQIGDAVKKGDVLLEVETDKAVLPIESFARGYITEIYVNEFDKIDAGTPLLAIGDENDLKAAREAAVSAPSSPSEEIADDEDDFVPVVKAKTESEPEAIPEESKSLQPTANYSDTGVKAMPNAKKLAFELGVELKDIKPSNGIFVKAEDVRAVASQKVNSAPAIDKAAAEVIPTARIRNTLARRWDASVAVPTVTVSVTVSAENADKLTAEMPEISYAYFVMLALAKLSERYPLLGVCYENGEQKQKALGAAGLAVFAENGTVSTVVKSAAHIGLIGISEECKKNIAAINTGDLSSVGGAAFTVFDASAYCVDSFTAPINAPEVASFGVTGKNANGSFTVTGCFDIRLFEGNVCASVMSDLRDRLENPALLLL